MMANDSICAKTVCVYRTPLLKGTQNQDNQARQGTGCALVDGADLCRQTSSLYHSTGSYGVERQMAQNDTIIARMGLL